ncbi:MAG: hypothetical protein R3B72_26590 [Polyangiaceae bacterium]
MNTLRATKAAVCSVSIAILCTAAFGCAVDADESSTEAVNEAQSELLGGGPMIPLQTCDTTYVPPGVWPGIDPVALFGAGATSCAAASSSSPCAPHKVYTPSPVREREPLFVFLPGTNMEPNKHDLVLATAASVGYRSIGLSYDNTVAAATACAGLEACGLDCRGLVREEVARGIDLTPVVNVAREDGVLVRLYRLLAHLDAIDPAGGWGSYYVPTAGNITASNIVWSNIILGGFSQGAGVAAAISRVFQVHGLFVLDGAKDTCIDPVTGDELPAEYLTTGSDASAGRPKYGVRHDHGTGDTTTSDSWQTLGLGTSLRNIDTFDFLPPPGASVTTQGHPASPAICSDHMSMARDACMPTDLAGATGATAPTDYFLYEAYARRLCYACDATTCP